MKSRKRRPLTDDERWIVEHNLKMAGGIAKRYLRIRKTRDGDLDYWELFSAACDGLCHAITKYDPQVSIFPPYAWGWMASYIQRAILDNHLIKIRPNVLYKGHKLYRMARETRDNLVLLDSRWLDHLINLESPDDEDEASMDWLRQAIESLPDRKRRVMDLMLDGEGYAEIGHRLGVNRQTARNIGVSVKRSLAVAYSRKAVTA